MQKEDGGGLLCYVNRPDTRSCAEVEDLLRILDGCVV